MSDQTADLATLQRVIDDTFEALGVTDNEAALVEIERLQAAARVADTDREAAARETARAAWKRIEMAGLNFLMPRQVKLILDEMSSAFAKREQGDD